MRKGTKHTAETIAKISAACRGRHLSAAHCAKMSAARKGKPKSAEWRAHIGDAHRGLRASKSARANMSASHIGLAAGDKHPCWKGGVTLERDRAKHSQEYAHWRKAVFERDNYTCQVCGRRGGRLEAHHIIWWSQCRSVFCDVNNGITACKLPCHRKLLHAPSMRLAG